MHVIARCLQYFPAVLLLTLSALTIAEEECTRIDPVPIVNPEHPSIANYQLNTEEHRQLVESVELRSGQLLTISQFGCHHFGLSYEFKLPHSFDGNFMTQAKHILQLVSQFAPVHTAYLAEAISSVPDDFSTPELVTLVPGYSWIYLSAKTENDEHYFVVDYDIAL